MEQLHVKTRTRCLASRDARFCMLDLSKHRAAIQSDCDSILSDIFNAKIHKTAFSSKTYTVLNELLNCLQRESCSFGDNYPLSFLTIVYNSPFIIRVYLGLATVLLFVTIVLDEVTPKDMCIHTKLIIVRDLK